MADGRYIVRFKTSGLTASSDESVSVRAVGQTLGVPARSFSRPDNSAVVVLSKEQLAEISKRGDVLDVEEDVRVHTSFTPNDPSYEDQYGLQVIDAPLAWDTTTGSPSVVVGVIDTGVDTTHPDLAANIYQNTNEIPDNGFDDDGNGFVDDVAGYNFSDNDSRPLDGNGHGTHCAGVVAAQGDNGVGVTGVAFTAKIMPLKALADDGAGFFSDVARAIDYAVLMKDLGHPIRILSLSLGGEYSAVVDRSIQRAATKGVLIVAAAGNDGVNIDRTPQYPASFGYSNILAVAAVDGGSSIAGFSNFGRKNVDIAAPGVAVLSTLPASSRLGSDYGVLSGTSMATPHVAGAAALVASANSQLTMSQIRATLLSSVTPNIALVGVLASGGVLNADTAVQVALGATPARSVFGQVLRGKKALKGATVKLVSSDKTYNRSVATDVAGGFLFDDVNAGNYTLSVKKKNFDCRKPNKINVSSDANVTQMFTCKPKPVS